MDHTEAVRLQAATKYLLGEMPKEQHAAYEEHYFDCSACADEIKATAIFFESSRQLSREKALQLAEDNKLAAEKAAKGGWFAWLRPAFAVPVLAGLLVVIGYQNGVTIPSLKEGVGRAPVAEVAQHFTLPAISRRGGASEPKTIKVDPRRYFNLAVDMPAGDPSPYVCQIRDSAGNIRHTVRVSLEDSKNSVEIKIPAGSLQPGKYELLAFRGDNPSTIADDNTPKQSFAVEFVQ